MPINLIFWVCLPFAFLFAQNDTSIVSYKFIHLGVGGFSFKGDLGGNQYSTFTPGIVAEVRFNKKKKFNGGLNFNYFTIIAEDATPDLKENISNFPVNFVKTRVGAVEYRLHLNVIKNKTHLLYVGQGVGFAYFQTFDDSGARLIDRANTRARDENYNNLTLTTPTVVGYRWMWNENLGLWSQLKWLRQTNDYFDNLSELSDASTKDNVFSVQFGIAWVLGLKPTANNPGKANYKNKSYRKSLKGVE